MKENKTENYNLENLFIGLGAKKNQEDLFTAIGKSYQEIESLLNTTYPSNRKLSQDDKEIEKIKSLLETAILRISIV